MDAPAAGPRILLVDDDEDFLFQHRIQLENAGFEVATATTRGEAEEKSKSFTPDLAILDLMMEHHDDGFVLSHHLKRRFPGLPVILVTAVTRMIGSPGNSRLRRCDSTNPSSWCSIMRSRIAMSGWNSDARVSASPRVEAVATSNPAFSSWMRCWNRKSSSSSTIRTRGLTSSWCMVCPLRRGRRLGAPPWQDDRERCTGWTLRRVRV